MLPLLPLLQSLLRFHGSHPSYFFVGLDSCFLEALNSFLEFVADAGIFSCKLDDATQTILCFNAEPAKFVIQVVQFWIVGDVGEWYFHIIVLTILVEGDQSAFLPFLLHFLEYLNEVFQFFLQFFGGTADQRREVLRFCIWLFFDHGPTDCAFSFGGEVDLLPSYFVMDPLRRRSGVYLSAFLVQDGDNLVFGVGKAFVLLESGVEVELAHLGCAQGYLQEIYNFDELIHAELCVWKFAFVEGDED